MKTVIASLALAAATLAAPAVAQESSYTPGTVWEFSQIKVQPGQFENYMDYLNGPYKRQMEMQKKMGYLVSYHIFAVNDPRKDDPDLILATEYKDYVPTAQQLDAEKKMMAAMSSDPHKSESASGDRQKMRTEMGSMQTQELMLK